MTTIEDKIRKLLALASDPGTPVEEARTAAMHAARLMREHKVEVGTGVTPVFPPSPAPMPSWAAVGTLIHTMVEIMLRQHPAPPAPPPSAPRTPFDELFWDRWEKEHPATTAPIKKRRRSKQSRKNNPNRERRRKTR